jgi:hypothetical protein
MKKKAENAMSLLGAAVLVLTISVSCCACPNCKNSQPDSDDPGLAARLSNAYLWSYVAMTSMPFLTVGTFFGAVVYLKRKNGAKTDSSKF